MNPAIPQTSLFLGIIPALIFLYLSLKGYEGLYKEKNIYLSFVIGIILGFFAALAQSFTLSGVILYIILIVFFDQLIKTIALNIGRLHEKKETIIYGLCLGLGFGAIFTPVMLIAVSSLITSDAVILALIAIASLGIILFHAATGAYIGYGVYKKKLTRSILFAILLQIPFNGILDLIIIYAKNKNQILTETGLVAGLVIYGTLSFWYVITKIMPQIRPNNERRKRRRLLQQK